MGAADEAAEDDVGGKPYEPINRMELRLYVSPIATALVRPESHLIPDRQSWR